MTIQAIDGAFTVCQVKDFASADWTKPFTFAARTDEELSLVCRTENVPEEIIRREDGWRAFRVQGTLDFALVGILSGIASVLAEERISIFALSTYNTDYVLVKEKEFLRAMDALKKNGYKIDRGGI